MAKRNINIRKRGEGKRRNRPVYLIISEGMNKTETTYFSNYQGQNRNYTLRFVKAGHHTDAESMYDILVSKWKELELSEELGDKGFVVLDIDNDPVKAQKVRELIQNNKNKCISFIVSNPTFEIWFLLHYKYTSKFYLDGEAVIKDLKKYIPNYDKALDCYSLCGAETERAIENADKLAALYKDSKWPSEECNPRTDVGDLVKLLMGIIDDIM